MLVPWTANWDNPNTLFNYPEDIRKAIYTTNAIESLNSVIKKAKNKRKLFPTDEPARKVVFPGHSGCFKEMDNADKKLAPSPKPIYDYVRSATH